MILNEKIYCETCGKTFYSKSSDGYVDHLNATNNYRIDVSRFYNGWDRKILFLDSIGLYDNFCMIKNINYETSLEIFECRIKWMKINNYPEIVEFLEGKRKDIKKEFNKITNIKIKELEEEINKLKKDIK